MSLNNVKKQGYLIKAPVTGFGLSRKRLIRLRDSLIEWCESEGKPSLGNIALYGAKLTTHEDQLVVASGSTKLRLRPISNASELRSWAEEIGKEIKASRRLTSEERDDPSAYGGGPTIPYPILDAIQRTVPFLAPSGYKTSSQEMRANLASMRQHEESQRFGHTGTVVQKIEQAAVDERKALGGSNAQRVAAVEGRAAKVGLPPHLKLGLTFAGLEKLLFELPVNAVELHNEWIPPQKNADGEVIPGSKKFPISHEVNGYVNQSFVQKRCGKEVVSMCEKLRNEDSPDVGVATVFVSWFLDTRIDVLLDVLDRFLGRHPTLDRKTTCFWVCDFCIRQRDVETDLKWLGECVECVGHTALVLDPWDDPGTLKRAYCLKEVIYTETSKAHFDVALSTKQQEAFGRALHESADALEGAWVGRIDVRQGECRKKSDQEAILRELDEKVGFAACNAKVTSLLKRALVRESEHILAKVDPHTRKGLLSQAVLEGRKGGYVPNNVVALMINMGVRGEDVASARGLIEENVRTRRLELKKAAANLSAASVGLHAGCGDLMGSMQMIEAHVRETKRQPSGDLPLSSFAQTVAHSPSYLHYFRVAVLMLNNLGVFFCTYPAGGGTDDQAKELFGEASSALKALAQATGSSSRSGSSSHAELLTVHNNLALLLCKAGQHDDARALLERALEEKRTTCGEGHKSTLLTMHNVGLIMSAQGDHAGGKAVLESCLALKAKACGTRHASYLATCHGLCVVLMAMGDEASLTEARKLLDGENGCDALACEIASDHPRAICISWLRAISLESVGIPIPPPLIARLKAGFEGELPTLQYRDHAAHMAQAWQLEVQYILTEYDPEEYEGDFYWTQDCRRVTVRLPRKLDAVRNVGMQMFVFEAGTMGLEWEFLGDCLRVARVAAGTPAEEKGVQRGMELVMINGKPTATVASEWRLMKGQHDVAMLSDNEVVLQVLYSLAATCRHIGFAQARQPPPSAQVERPPQDPAADAAAAQPTASAVTSQPSTNGVITYTFEPGMMGTQFEARPDGHSPGSSLVVIGVVPDSQAARLGLMAGMIVAAVEGMSTADYPPQSVLNTIAQIKDRRRRIGFLAPPSR